jgi:hypothetical protein
MQCPFGKLRAGSSPALLTNAVSNFAQDDKVCGFRKKTSNGKSRSLRDDKLKKTSNDGMTTKKTSNHGSAVRFETPVEVTTLWS